MKNENKNWSKLGSVSLYWIYHLRLLTECYILYKKAVKLLDQLLVNFSLGNGLCKIVDFGWYKILSFSSHWNCGSSGWPDAEKTLALRRSAQLEGSLSKTQSLAPVTQLQKCKKCSTDSTYIVKKTRKSSFLHLRGPDAIVPLSSPNCFI